MNPTIPRKIKATFKVDYTSKSLCYDVWWFENGRIQPDDGKTYDAHYTLAYDQFIHAVYNEARRIKSNDPYEQIIKMSVAVKDHPQVQSRVAANSNHLGCYTDPRELIELLDALEMQERLSETLPTAQPNTSKEKFKL